MDLFACSFKVYQEYAGIIVIMVCSKAELVDIVCQLRLSCMRGGSKKISFQICLPQRPEGIDDQDIRIQVQDAVEVVREELRRQQPVIHFPRILCAHRGICKSRAVRHDRIKAKAKEAALASDAGEVFIRKPAVDQPDVGLVFRLGDMHRSEKHLQPGQIIFIEGREDLYSVLRMGMFLFHRGVLLFLSVSFQSMIFARLYAQFMHSKSLHEQGGACDDQIGCKDIIERQR